MLDWLIPVILLFAFIAMIGLVWRMVSSLQETAGFNMLRTDRERLDYQHFLQTLMEKLDNPHNETIARNHAQERIVARQLDSKEREQLLKGENRPEPAADLGGSFPPSEIEDAVHI